MPVLGQKTSYQPSFYDYTPSYTPAGIGLSGSAAIATQAGVLYTNKTPQDIWDSAKNYGIRGAASVTGFPSIGRFSAQLLQKPRLVPGYSTLPFEAKNNKLFDTSVEIPFLDFRARKFRIRNLTGDKINTGGDITAIIDRRFDGAAAALRGSAIAGVIAASNALTGPYTLLNLNSKYGFGSQDDPDAIRSDYTLRSSVGNPGADTKNGYRKALSFFESTIPFRGDRVNAIDFKLKRTWNSIYQWQDLDIDLGEKVEKFRESAAAASNILGVNPYGSTKDLVKFFFTGPKLYDGANETAVDWSLVFRAILTSFSDQFSPSWTQVNLVGRADPNYQYGGFSRDVDLGFTVYASDRDELRIMYRKLNYLAGLTVPTYTSSSISMVAPWLRITVGDLLVSQAAVINSLSYTFVDADTTWEINYEEDPEMMEAPHKVDVSMGLHLVGNQLPQQHGSMYSLSREFDINGVPLSRNPGKGWLYDSKTVSP